MSGFVHLHLHSQYSLLDGAIKIKELVSRAGQFKMPAVAVTDHGNMYGALDFYFEAKKAGIKPIVGSEVYVAPGSRLDKAARAENKENNYHLILLAKDYEGYKNLIKLSSIGYLEGFYYKPRIDPEILSQYSKGLIALSACLKGEIPSLLLSGRFDEACKKAVFYREMFPDAFYIELQENGIPEQKKANELLIKLAKELDIPLVATNDCHYMDKSDAEAHEVLLCLQTGKTLNDEDRMRFQTDEFYFKPPENMIDSFSYISEAVENTIKIADACNLEIPEGKIYLPHYQPPEGYGLFDYLKHLAYEGLNERLKERALSESEREIYVKRLEYELEMLHKMGFEGYFLIVWDFINFAKSKGYPVGPGRGSAAGSLVAYAVKITDIDPIPYNLLFERFLNPERISLPDIDVDFCKDYRDEVIKYVTDKYGLDKVSQIITFGSLKAKAVVRDVARVMGLSYAEADRLAKLIPNRLNITLDEALKEELRLTAEIKKDERIKKLFEIAMVLEGLNRHASTHAAGVVISDTTLTDHVPLAKSQKGKGSREDIVTQYEMKYLEKAGLIKFDFLGLKTLTLIARTVELVRKKDPGFALENIVFNDSEAYKIISDGNTNGIFQLESSGITDLAVKVKPSCFEDIVAIIALYRPGPMDLIPTYIARKNGKEKVEQFHPLLESITKETYGILIYQEQVMQAAQMLAGYTLGSADILRRAMGKKDPEAMLKQKEIFIKGCYEKNNIPKEKAEEIFSLLEKFAGYGFNKSHSAAYAVLSYQTAYLKAHYTKEFMAALLTSEMGDHDKVQRYINECKAKNIAVLPPDVNESFEDFTADENGIRFGLCAIKNVGSTAVESVIKARKEHEFSSLFDFCSRVNLTKVNKKVSESLIKAGAFDFTGENRAVLLASLDKTLDAGLRSQKEKNDSQISFFGAETAKVGINNFHVKTVSGLQELEILRLEKEALGYYVSKHPLSEFKEETEKYTTAAIQEIIDLEEEKEVIFAGVINQINEKKSKKGEMAFLTVEDLTGSIEVTVFSELYKRITEDIKSGIPLIFKGKVDFVEEGKNKVLLEDAVLITKAEEKFSSRIRLKVNAENFSSEQFKKLKEVLESNPGRCRVYIELNMPEPDWFTVELIFPEGLKVSPSRRLIKDIKDETGCSGIEIILQ